MWWVKNKLEKVTAVLITKLSEYPKEIRLDGFGEVIIKTNAESVFERYIQAERAKNEIIYVQDDDCVTDYKKLFKHYNGRITNAISGRRQFYDDISGGRITLVGWGAFFPKSMLGLFKNYTDKYGIDFHLLREADRIFTWLNYPHNTIRMEHKDLGSSSGPDRMSMNPQHFEYLNQTIEKLKNLNKNL